MDYLIEVILNGESEGKLPFSSSSNILGKVLKEFLSDKGVREDLGVDLHKYWCKRIEEYSAKFDDWVRTKEYYK